MPPIAFTPTRPRPLTDIEFCAWIAALASAAHRAFDAGLVHLVQVRLGPDRFAYIAIARTRPRRAPVPLVRPSEDAEAA